MSKSLKAAIFCGSAPLVTGLGVYLAWRITRTEELMFVGLLTLGAGTLAFFAGVAFLATHHFRRAPGAVVRPGRSLTVLALLGLNFPVAAFCLWSATDIATRYTLTVINEGPQTVTGFKVTGAGIVHGFPPVAPGESVSGHFHPTADGSLDFTARRGDREISGRIEAYTTPGLGGEKTVRIKPDGAWTGFSRSDESR